MKSYFKYFRIHMKTLLQYKVSFILSLISQILTFFSYYFVILSLFDKFSNIKGYTLYEVLLTFAIIQLGYSIIEVFARGLDKFDNLIISGNFDRLLLRPQNLILQICCQEIAIEKLGRFLQCIIILVYSLIKLNLDFSLLKVISLILMVLSAVVIFFGLFLIAASYCFFTIQGLEVRNLLTDGGKFIAQYPMGIFKKGLLIFFTFIIPYSLVNYYPLLYVLGKSDNVVLALSPLLVFLYLIPCILVFKLGLKKYSSVGC